MHLTRRADYAVRCLVAIVQQGRGRRLAAEEVARVAGVPLSYARKILHQLCQHGILHSLTGPTGGVRLARESRAVSLLDVLEAVDGEICLSACLKDPAACPRHATCTIRPVWGRVQQILRRALSEVSVQELENGSAANKPELAGLAAAGASARG